MTATNVCCCCPPAVNALLCLYVRSGCSKGTVAGALTFFPPEPPLYRFERYDENGKLLSRNSDEITQNEQGYEGNVAHAGHVEQPNKSPVHNLTIRQAELRKRAKKRNLQDIQDKKNNVIYRITLDPRLSRPSLQGGTIEALKIPSKNDTHLATLIYRVSDPQPTTKTILFSHGNATDIGAMYTLQARLVNALNTNVVMYDYSGYGESGGMATEAESYRDLQTVYEYVRENVCNDTNNIVLYGQSVGSGPSCQLAYKNNELGGMILHSPFTSGMRVLTPSRLLGCLDIYPNMNRIQHVRCPVMVIHGRLDQEVPFSHGVEMHRRVPPEFQRDPWWIQDRGHNDIIEGKWDEYIRRLRDFLESLDD